MWNQLEIMIDSNQLSFNNETEMLDFFKHCCELVQETNCDFANAANKLYFKPVLEFKEEQKEEVVTNFAETIEVMDSFPTPLSTTITRKGKKK